MNQPPNLFDRDALTLKRERAVASPNFPDFLHRRAAEEVSERLTEVNRPFTDRAFVGAFSDFWGQVLPLGQVFDTGENLQLPRGKFDLVVHAVDMHWSNDPVGQLVQMRHALREDGMMIAVFPGGQTLHELRAVFAHSETEIRGGVSPRVAPMGDIRDMGNLLHRAGLALPVADSVLLDTTYPTATALMRELRNMGETNCMVGREQRFSSRALLEKVQSTYFAQHANTDGRIRATFELLFLTGWAPSENQQKPLRPGSATVHLSAALAEANSDKSDNEND